MSWLLPRIGAFSVYREGMDRESLKTAINILATASRPLVIFAEGVITRTNDRLISLQDGVAFIARTAAKQRAEANPPGKVVIHPVALRYTFGGDVEKSLAPVLDRIEVRLSWQPQRALGAAPARRETRPRVARAQGAGVFRRRAVGHGERAARPGCSTRCSNRSKTNGSRAAAKAPSSSG